MMRQALHLFGKDIRQFWIEIAAVLILVFCFPISQSHTLGTVGLTLLIPLASVFLIMRVLHADAIPGDRQFWVTRPYDRRSLLAAKTMFVITFVNLPLMAMQAVILARQDFPVASNLGGLLWAQALLSVVIFLPAAAVASVTSTTAQFFLSFLTLYSVVFFDGVMHAEATDGSLGPIQWIRNYAGVSAILLIGVSIMLLQFLRRRTSVSRPLTIVGTALGLAIYTFMPWNLAFAIQSRLSKSSPESLRIDLDPARTFFPDLHTTGGFQVVDLAFLVTGLPEGGQVQCDAADITIENAAGNILQSGLLRFNSGRISPLEPAGCVVAMPVPMPLRDVRMFWYQPVRVRVKLDVTVLGSEHSTVLQTIMTVPSVGHCNPGAGSIRCQSPFRPPSSWVAVKEIPESQFAELFLSYSPFPSALHFDPIEDFAVASAPHDDLPHRNLTVVTRDVLAHHRYDLEFRDIPLPDAHVSPLF